MNPESGHLVAREWTFLEESLRRLRLDLAQARDLRGSLRALEAAEREILLFSLEGLVSALMGPVQSTGGDCDFTDGIPPELELPKAWEGLVREFLIEGLRNWRAHGRESKAERKFLRKPDRHRLRIRAWILAGRVVLSLEDDGPGLNPQLVLSRARELGILPVAEQARMEEELRRGNAASIYQLLFRDGLSTRVQADESAGRGMGLSRLASEAARLGALLLARKSEDLGGLCMRLELPCRMLGLRAGHHSLSTTGNEILSSDAVDQEMGGNSGFRIFSLLPAESASWAREQFSNPQVAWVALGTGGTHTAGGGSSGLISVGLLVSRGVNGQRL